MELVLEFTVISFFGGDLFLRRLYFVCFLRESAAGLASVEVSTAADNDESTWKILPKFTTANKTSPRTISTWTWGPCQAGALRRS